MPVSNRLHALGDIYFQFLSKLYVCLRCPFNHKTGSCVFDSNILWQQHKLHILKLHIGAPLVFFSLKLQTVLHFPKRIFPIFTYWYRSTYGCHSKAKLYQRWAYVVCKQEAAIHNRKRSCVNSDHFRRRRRFEANKISRFYCLPLDTSLTKYSLQNVKSSNSLLTLNIVRSYAKSLFALLFEVMKPF